MNSILVQHAGLGGKLYGVIIKIKGLGFIWVPIYQLINTVELWFWSIIIIGGLCKHFIWLEDMYFTWFPCLTVYPSKPADKISVNSHMCVFFSVPSLISCLHTLLSPPQPSPTSKLVVLFHLCTKRFLCKPGHLSVIVWGPNSGKIPCHWSRVLWMAAPLWTIGGGAEEYSWEDYLTFQFRGHKA